MPAPIPLEKMKLRLDSALPNWRALLVENRAEFPAIWQGVSGESRANSFSVRSKGDEILKREIDAILDRYLKGEMGPQLTASLLLPYVREDIRNRDGYCTFLPDGLRVYADGHVEQPERDLQPDLGAELHLIDGEQ